MSVRMAQAHAHVDEMRMRMCTRKTGRGTGNHHLLASLRVARFSRWSLLGGKRPKPCAARGGGSDARSKCASRSLSGAARPPPTPFLTPPPPEHPTIAEPRSPTSLRAALRRQHTRHRSRRTDERHFLGLGDRLHNHVESCAGAWPPVGGRMEQCMADMMKCQARGCVGGGAGVAAAAGRGAEASVTREHARAWRA